MSALQPQSGILRIRDEDIRRVDRIFAHEFLASICKKNASLSRDGLSHYIQSKGISDYKTYLQLLFSDKSGQEISTAINYLTTNLFLFHARVGIHTFFSGRKFSLNSRTPSRTGISAFWSAGCSTGEEPYTLAIACLTSFSLQTKPFGTRKSWQRDISEKVLIKAERGVFDADAISEVPPVWIRADILNGIRTSLFRVTPTIQKGSCFSQV